MLFVQSNLNSNCGLALHICFVLKTALPADSCLRRAARRRSGRANAHRFGGTLAASTVCLHSTARGQRDSEHGMRCVNGVHPCTPLHILQNSNRSSQTLHSGVRWPGCQFSLGTRSLARHGKPVMPNSSPSQNRPVMRPQSTQGRQRSVSNPVLTTVRLVGFALGEPAAAMAAQGEVPGGEDEDEAASALELRSLPNQTIPDLAPISTHQV